MCFLHVLISVVVVVQTKYTFRIVAAETMCFFLFTFFLPVFVLLVVFYNPISDTEINGTNKQTSNKWRAGKNLIHDTIFSNEV